MKTTLLVVLLLASRIFAQDANQPTLILPDQTETERMKKWRDLGYGLFICFNMNTFTGIQLDLGKAPATKYKPDKLDVNQWIRTAKEAGMKYAVLTTKHTGGFCLWDSKVPFHGKEFDYDVAATGNKTDVVKAFVDACKKYGIVPGFYYSLMDSRHNSVKGRAQFRSFLLGDDYFELVKGHLTELLTNYPDCHYYWIDVPRSASQKQLTTIYNLLRKNDPRNVVLFNSHLGWGKNSDSFFEDAKGFSFPTDVINTENRPATTPVSKFQRWQGKKYFVGYEHCHRLHERWFWVSVKISKPHPVKGLFNLYKTVRSNGGNLLLNVGPNRRGIIEQRYINTLMQLKQRIEPWEKSLQTPHPRATDARTRGITSPTSDALRPLGGLAVGVALARGEVRQRTHRSGHVEQDGVRVVVHRQVDAGMAHGGHGGAGVNAGGREVRSEGMPQGVDVNDTAT